MPLLRPLNGHTPQLGQGVFLAESAELIGDVRVGARSSIWYQVVLRGDVMPITIGEESNIQDGAIVHGTYQKAAAVIGNRVTVGHGAIIHGATLQDRCLVGMKAVVLDNAVVESGCIVAAGAVVTAGTVCKAGWIYAGIPAKPVKELGLEAGLHGNYAYADAYLMYQRWYTQPNA